MPSRALPPNWKLGTEHGRGLKAAFCFGVRTITLLHTWRSEDNMQKAVLFSTMWVLETQTQAIKLVGKYIYPLSILLAHFVFLRYGAAT